MQGVQGSKTAKFGPPSTCALWSVDIKLTHLDWNPEASLIHFQGQYLTVCDLDYNILQGEIQSVPKTKAAVDIGEFCLIEDLTSGRWYRGRVQNRKEDLFNVFLIDHGSVLSVDIAHISSCSNDLFILPPKLVCGFLANVLPLQGCSFSDVEVYFSGLIGRSVTGYIQALLPHKVLLLEAPDINIDFVKHGFGRHVDTDTFLLLVEMLTELPLKQNMEPVPDLLIEKPRVLELCFKTSGLQGYEEILSFCGPRLSCGTRAKVRVTAAVNQGLFYCQMKSMETDLLDMSKKLAAVNEYQTKQHNRKTPENLGLLCSVKGKDGNWYRGFVQFLPVNSQLRVLFIDYGFLENVKVENVYRLPPEFFLTPIMAIPCSFSSLSYQDMAVKTQQFNFLKEGLLGRVLDVEINGFDEEQHLYSITVIGVEENFVMEPEAVKDLPGRKVESILERGDWSPRGGSFHWEAVMVDALDKTMEAEDLHVGFVFVGYVEHVQNPSNFWMRTEKHNEEFEEMMSELADNFRQVKLDENVLESPERGALCCALYEKDMNFYRGIVTDTLEHGAEILFIDFGNTEKVPHMLIKKMPETFASKSAFAFCCSLVNVMPSDDLWTSATSDFFRRAVLNKALLVHVVQMRKNKFVVDLYEIESDNYQSITELLISSKQADYWNDIPIKPVVQNNKEFTEAKCERYSLTSDISGKQEQSNDFDDKEKKGEDQIEKAQAPSSFKALSIKPGCNFAVCCSYVKSPSDFWCQPLDKVPALEELMDKINQHYTTSTVTFPPGESCCVVKSPQDGRWYRAFITDKKKGHATVILVDYGFTIQVREHSLEAIVPDFLNLERQAFRCSLYNIMKPVDHKTSEDWSLEECKMMKDLVVDNTGGLRCEVVSQVNVKTKGLCNVVELYSTQTQKSITDLLLKQGLKKEVTVSTEPVSGEFPETFVYTSNNLSPGNEEQVFVTHVGNQWEIYCHLERNMGIIEELEKKISEESKKMMQASQKAVLSKLCLAKYFDGKWYRGMAHPIQSPLHLFVFFVDYGNTSISEKTHVMFIPKDSADLLYTPMQAVKCHLARVSKESKEELYADVKDWLVNEILNKQVRAVIVGKREDGSFDVELFDGDDNVNEKVKELMLGLSPKPKAAVSFDMSSTKTGHPTQHRRKAKNGKSQQKGQSSNPSISDALRSTQAWSSTCKNKENTKCVNDKALNKRKHAKLRNDGKTKSCAPVKITQAKRKRENYETGTNSEQPIYAEKIQIPQLSCLTHMKVSEGLRAKCFVSQITSINSFYLQLAEDEPAILKMIEDLNSSVVKDSLATATMPLKINDLVLAEYEADGALYRSIVKDYESSSCIKIEFLDYGNSTVVGKEKIYSLPKEYLCQSRFSISCSLLDSSEYENDASFTDAVMEKPLMVDFVLQHETHWKVKVEILNEEVPAEHKAAGEISTETENEWDAPVGSSEMEKKMESCEENYMKKEVCVDETTKSERMMPTVDSVNLKLKPSPATLSPTLEAHLNRNMDDSETERTTSNCSVEARGDCANEVIPPIIKAKDTENGTVLSVLNNGSFYTRLSKTIELLPALEQCITDSLNKCEMVSGEDIRQGLKCLVQVRKDKQWHRAVVQHVGLDKCQVLLVDHGITEEIPSGSMRQQCRELLKTPHLAVLCKVNCKEKAGHELCGNLKSQIGEELKLTFVRYSEADGLWMVDIVINGLFLICKIKNSLQQNKEMIPSPTDTQSESKGETNLDTSPPQQLVFAPVDIDKAYSGFAAAVTTPFEFCVVLEDLLLDMNKVSIMLDDLPGQMSPLPENHFVPGTGCLLTPDTKKKWCRAEIVHADSPAILNLVDYGHHECIPYDDFSKLKRLPEEMTKIPKVTYPCILRGVKPVGGDGHWTDEAVVFFQQSLYQKNLQIFFREFVSNTHWKVDVLADGVHVAKELVDAGHAGYMDLMLGLRFQEQSSCQAAAQSPDSEEECGEEDEVDGKSDLCAQSPGEAEGNVQRSAVPGSAQCFLM